MITDFFVAVGRIAVRIVRRVGRFGFFSVHLLARLHLSLIHI